MTDEPMKDGPASSHDAAGGGSAAGAANPAHPAGWAREGSRAPGLTSSLAGGPRPSVRDALAHAARVDPPAPDAEERARDAIVQLERNHAPWYLRLLVGAGAWLAAAFLLPFIGGITYLIVGDVPAVGVVLGLLLTAAATFGRMKTTGLFGRQAMLVLGFAGQVLVLIGVGGTLESSGAICIAAILVAGALLATHPDRIQRFCSTVAIVVSLVVLIADNRVAGALDGLVLTLVFALLALWRLAPRAVTDERADQVEPVVYAIVLSLFGLLITDAAFGYAMANTSYGFLRLTASAKIGFVVALLWLVSAIFAEQGVPLARVEPIAAFAGIALLGVLTRQSPAIIVAMLVGLLGFDRRAPMIVVLAAAFFLGFGAFFYYSLSITLMQKSLLLVASGILCLAACAFLARKDSLVRLVSGTDVAPSSGEAR